MHRNTKFDIDFNDFNKKVKGLTNKVKKKLENTYDNIWDTPHSFKYLYRFEILAEKLPIGGMEDKYKRMVVTFKSEMDKTMKFYKRKQKILVQTESQATFVDLFPSGVVNILSLLVKDNH